MTRRCAGQAPVSTQRQMWQPTLTCARDALAGARAAGGAPLCCTMQCNDLAGRASRHLCSLTSDRHVPEADASIAARGSTRSGRADLRSAARRGSTCAWHRGEGPGARGSRHARRLAGSAHRHTGCPRHPTTPHVSFTGQPATPELNPHTFPTGLVAFCLPRTGSSRLCCDGPQCAKAAASPAVRGARARGGREREQE